MIATEKQVKLEDEFEEKILRRSARAREGRPEYKYPERKARGGCGTFAVLSLRSVSVVFVSRGE